MKIKLRPLLTNGNQGISKSNLEYAACIDFIFPYIPELRASVINEKNIVSVNDGKV